MKIYRECDFCKKELEERNMKTLYGSDSIFKVCDECSKRYQEYDKKQKLLYNKLKEKLDKGTLKLQQEYKVIRQIDTKIRVEEEK